MRVIGVIDLRGGLAVHARGGVRAAYTGVVLPIDSAAKGDAVALARFYVDRIGLRELYVADLDAIAAGQPQLEALDRIVAVGVPVWLDAAVTTPEAGRDAVSRGAARIVVGLETLPRAAVLTEICEAVGGERTVFSLDLRSGRPITGGGAADGSPESIARDAREAGVTSVIVLDLARVGSGAGIDRELFARVRAAVPDVTLVAGGGISGRADLDAARAAGADAVLVASALLDGRLTAAEVHYANSSR